MKGLAARAVIALVVSACTGGGAGSDDLTLTVVAPADGAEVSIPFDVEVASNVPLDAPETGNHHVHLYFDTDISSPDYDLVYGTTWQVTRELTPGEHTIIASLRNPDHSDAGPNQTFSITVGEAGQDGASESAAPSADTSDPESLY